MEKQIYVDTRIRYTCASEIGHPNEKLVFTEFDAVGGYVHFYVGDCRFYARLTKTGKTIRKGSVRRDH